MAEKEGQTQDPSQQKPQAEAKEKKDKSPEAASEKEPKVEIKSAEKHGTKPDEVRQKKGKKISRMKLLEVEAKLKTLPEKMGGFQSGFAQHLLARKKELTS